MPGRRRHRTNRVMRRRMGLRGWDDSRPYHPWSKTLVSRILGEGHNPGVTSGVEFALPVNNWNDPLGTGGGLVVGTGSQTTNRHPVKHNNAITDGYNVAQVLKWRCLIILNWIRAEDITGDYIVAYRFTQQDGTEVLLPAGPATSIEILEMLTSPYWTTKRFNASPLHRKRETVSINVPDVYQYVEAIHAGHQVSTTMGNGVMSHVIADTNSASNSPVVKLFCQVVVASLSGLVMLIDSLHITIQITQKVRIMRDYVGSQDLDEGEADVHA